MTNSRPVSGENQIPVLDYLKSWPKVLGNVDIAVSKGARTGVVHVREGRIVAAQWARLFGNGALLTLAATPDIVYQAVETTESVVDNVTLTLSSAERLLSTLAGFSPGLDEGDEEEKLHRAIHLFYQFRRKEAGALLVEILRANRFYYPAWLWHSRLMTRADYIKKALNEAKKWGNSDREIQLEAAKIEAGLDGSAATVKRCIFCWSVVQEKDDRCANCGGIFQVSGQKTPPLGESIELEKAIVAYRQEFTSSPGNPRIAYCLCLAFYSLGKIDQAREYLEKALKVSPKEALFVRTKTLLDSLANTAGSKEPRPAPVVPPSTAASFRPVVTPGKTILVVEDSQTSRKVITMLLERKGYAIREAKNGAEAMAALGAEVPDLVLLDLMLPDMSGYEILAKIRQSEKTADIPVIMLTGKSNPADRMKGLHHGSNEYLTKPFDPGKLLAVLEKYIDRPAPKSNPPKAKEPNEAPPKVVVKNVHQVKRPQTPPAPAAPASAKPATAVPAAAPRGTSKKSILVVEDSPTARKVISMVIAKRGYTVHEAATGAVALRKAQEGTLNLILLDAMLPDMTGYEILHRFKNDERLKDVPVVMLTAKNNPVDRQKGLKGGSAAYLTKPFDPEKLLAVIDEYIC